MKSSRMLYTVVAIQSVVLAYLVFAPAQPAAMAQVPDQGAQIQALIDQTKTVNTKLDRIVSIMESGSMKVKVVAEKPDKQ